MEFGDTNVRGKLTHTRFRLGVGNPRIRRPTRVPLESRRGLTCLDLLPTVLKVVPRSIDSERQQDRRNDRQPFTETAPPWDVIDGRGHQILCRVRTTHYTTVHSLDDGI